jgi:hypothetical protein
MTQLVDVTDPAENPIVDFDFTGELTAPASAVITVTPIDAVDPDAASMLIGSPQFSGASVLQRVKPNLAGVDYHLHCAATQGEETRVLAGIMPVRTA